MAFYKISQPSGEMFAAAAGSKVSDAVDAYYREFDDEPVVVPISREEYEEAFDACVD